MKNSFIKFIFATVLLSSFLVGCDQGNFRYINENEGYWGTPDYYIDDDYDAEDDGPPTNKGNSSNNNQTNSNNGGSSGNNGGQAGSSNNGGSASQTGNTVDSNNPYFDFTWQSSDKTAAICFKSGMNNPNPVIPVTYVYNGESYRIVSDDKAPGFSYMMSVETITIQEGFEEIINGFCHDMNLVSVKLPVSLKRIHAAPFVNCQKLQKVEYNGTKSQWNAITKDSGDDYNYGLPKDITIVCSDGNLTLAKDPDF